MYVPEIIEVKDKLSQMASEQLIKSWELPYENILTRRNAAIFFLTPESEDCLYSIANQLDEFENFSYRENTEKKLSQMKYRITFSEEEKVKNEKQEQDSLAEIRA